MGLQRKHQTYIIQRFWTKGLRNTVNAPRYKLDTMIFIGVLKLMQRKFVNMHRGKNAGCDNRESRGNPTLEQHKHRNQKF